MKRQYIVSQEPKRQWRVGMVTLVVVIDATSKADAIRVAAPHLALAPNDSTYFRAPRAEFFTPGTPYRF